MYKPKLISCLRNYDKKTLTSDLMAGIIVGIVALPLAIAFGIASGVSPEKGIITAIVAGLLISVFGGSKVQIGGPTGAFIIIIYGIIEQYGLSGLTIATLMAGAFLILFGILRLGTIIQYIPYPIVVGFRIPHAAAAALVRTGLSAGLHTRRNCRNCTFAAAEKVGASWIEPL